MTSRRPAALMAAAALVLAACGADGVPQTPPTPPDRIPTPQTRTNVGIELSTSGYASVGVGINRGPATLALGF
ncbi:hypothetical protein [Marinibacterium profundimaris]|uniref:Argininosuccinate lyase n=1 Tax=Marinibacterium profundimaris TaxID=1679460 RepID=A0A225NLK3_9RHOB|nr:hypothetical protein [Marinibacterium profundimaris]OWU73358.1 hypothetical protein ATO3_11730 [Marinibacterium profundimaris]